MHVHVRVWGLTGGGRVAALLGLRGLALREAAQHHGSVLRVENAQLLELGLLDVQQILQWRFTNAITVLYTIHTSTVYRVLERALATVKG